MRLDILVLLVLIVEAVVVEVAALLRERALVFAPFKDVEVVNGIVFGYFCLLVVKEVRSEHDGCLLGAHRKLYLRPSDPMLVRRV